MKFESLSEIQLLKICMQTRRAQLTPRIFDYKQRLERIFTEDSVELLADVSAEYHEASIKGQRPSADTIATYQKFLKIAKEYGDDAVDLVSNFRKTIINYQEFDRLINLNTDNERISTIQNYRQNPDSAPSQALVDFSESMTKRSPGTIAKHYRDILTVMKNNAKNNRFVNDAYIEKIGTFQQHLKTIYPIIVKAPQKKPTLTENPLLNDIKNGVPVTLAISNASKSHVGRQTLRSLIAAGIIVLSAFGMAQAHPVNSSSYSDFQKSGIVGQLFPENTKESLFNIESKLISYQEDALPTNDEFASFINSVDHFYSDTIKSVIANSYNEYADEQGLPRAQSVTFSYNDYNGTDNILRIVDESGKTIDVETNRNDLFEHNSIGVIYDAERKIDGYRDIFDRSKSVSSKIELLDKIHDDFYDVLDALTLDYTFEEAGIVSKLFGVDLTLVEGNQKKELLSRANEIQTLVQANENKNPVSQQAESEIVDDGIDDR